MEFDIQLYFRRAKAWPALFAEPAALYAALRVTGWPARPTTTTPPPTKGGIDHGFRLGESVEAFRQEARNFLDEALTDEVKDQIHRTGVHHSWDFHHMLVERRVGPRLAGGVRGPRPRSSGMLAFAEEFHRAGAPTYAAGTTLMVAGIINHIGTEEQKRLILPQALGGEIIIVLGLPSPSRVPMSLPLRPVRSATVTSGSSTDRRCSPPMPRRPTTSSC